MAEQVICLDTSILIDYFRKSNKSKSQFYQLTYKYELFAVSSITEYEIYIGSNPDQDKFWNELFNTITVLPFDSETNKIAISISRDLKKQRKSIDIPDLFIAATALKYNYPLATLNKKHFSIIKELKII